MEMTLPAWAPAFLAQYQQHGLKATAAKAVGTTTKAVDKLALDCIEFESALLEAEELAADVIEREAYRRAVEGVEKGVYYKGIHMDTEVVYSDTLMVKMLEAKRRRQFGNKTEITGKGGGPLQIVWRTFGGAAAEGQTHRDLGDITIDDLAGDLPTPNGARPESPNRAAASAPAVIDAEFRSFPLQAQPPAKSHSPSQQEIDDALSFV